MQSGSSVSCLNTLKPPSEVLISSSTPSMQLNLNPIGRLRFMRSCQRGCRMESSTVQTEEPARMAVLGYRLNGFFLQRPVINLIRVIH